MVEPIRLGFVGCGAIARDRHVPGFRGIDAVELLTVSTRTPTSSRAAAATHGFTRWTEDWREVTDDPEVDAVVVATWPDLHAEATIAALEAGKHVLVQARMARDAAEAQRMLEASTARPDQVAMLVPSPISFWADTTVRRLIADGAIGALRLLRLSWSVRAEGVEAWRRQRRFSGNNTLMLGIVYEALMRWVGPARTVAGVASLTEPAFAGPEGQELSADVPDHVALTMEMAEPLLASIELSATPRAEADACTIFGTDGALRIDFTRGQLELADRAGTWEPLPVDPAERGDWQVESDFIASIRDGAPVRLTDFATGLAYMRFTDAAVAAWRDGGRQAVDQL